MQAVRSYADRVDVFCQAGHVTVPQKHNDLLAFLEPMVHQVKAPSPGRLFHPKIWVLRFVDQHGEERYRLICGSRNLTDARSWDAAVSLEGRVTDRVHKFNTPIADFVESLAARVPAGVPKPRRRAIRDLATNLRLVEWEAPIDVFPDWLTFHVFGRSQAPDVNLTGYRRMIVSPYLNDAGLETLWPDGATGECTVVSRDDQLDGLNVEWKDWLLESGARIRVLDDGAAIADPDSDEDAEWWSLTGLHAKIDIVERDKRAHVFIGSANATGAAWAGNDEIMVEIVGKVGTYGVEATVGYDEKAKRSLGFSKILMPYEPRDERDVDVDDELRRVLERALRELATGTFLARADVTPSSVGLRVTSAEMLKLPAAVPADSELVVELLTKPGSTCVARIGELLDHEWPLSAIEEITPFVVLRLSAGKGARRVEASTVVIATLVNDPPDRLDRILAGHFKSPGDFLRFVLLLLQMSGEGSWLAQGSGQGGFTGFSREADGAGLLESILSVLASNPDSVMDIDRLATRLEATEEGRKILPSGWSSFWASVMEAHSTLGGTP